MISYPETEQFRNVISSITKRWHHYEQFVDRGFPRMTFVGTVKLHGSNGSIVFNKENGCWCQSRNNVLINGTDNAGFAAAMNPINAKFFNENVLPQSEIIRQFYDKGETIVFYGEWCGGNIQKNVALCELRKMFVIFKVAIVNRKENSSEENLSEDKSSEENSSEDKSSEKDYSRFWLEPEHWSHINAHSLSIYNIYEFPTYRIEIDFRSPQSSQNELVEITNRVEKQCPVAAQFNVFGVGEGVVWTEWQISRGSLSFKVKGEQHSVSKVKTLAPVNVEQMANIEEFVEYACTENRMQQGLDYLREQGLTTEMKHFSTFLTWLTNDIIKEEKDTMEKSNIPPKSVTRSISNKARKWFETQKL